MTIASRLRKLEQLLEVNHHRDWSLEQLIRAAGGELPPDEPPAAVVKPGHKSVAELILEALPLHQAEASR
jgi:hypothetical protein